MLWSYELASVFLAEAVVIEGSLLDQVARFNKIFFVAKGPFLSRIHCVESIYRLTTLGLVRRRREYGAQD